MDSRVREHAEVLVEHCTGVERGDSVVIRAPPVAEDLVVALHERLGERGASPTWWNQSARVERAYLRAADADALELHSHDLAAMEAADVVFKIRADRNTRETSDVDPATIAAYAEANEPILAERLDTQWVLTQHPAPGNAQDAGMSTEAYADFVYDAVTKDWEAQRAYQQQLVEILDPAEEVRVVSGDETDLTMRVAGMDALSDCGEVNLPGGEVYTSPVPDSVEGEVLFDEPLVRGGLEVTDVRLRFEGGEVVDYEASENEELLASVLDTDPGARRVGEFGVGMNRDIDRFTYNMLFDEKMGGTVHVALGKAVEGAVPEGRPFNDSAQHVDMLVDVREDSRIEVDGEVVLRDGVFRFEAGFDDD